MGEQIAQKIDDVLNFASNGLDEKDREIFYKSLILISNNLQKICDDFEKENK